MHMFVILLEYICHCRLDPIFFHMPPSHLLPSIYRPFSVDRRVLQSSNGQFLNVLTAGPFKHSISPPSPLRAPSSPHFITLSTRLLQLSITPPKSTITDLLYLFTTRTSPLPLPLPLHYPSLALPPLPSPSTSLLSHPSPLSHLH